LKNGAKIGIKIEKEGKWGKRKIRSFFGVHHKGSGLFFYPSYCEFFATPFPSPKTSVELMSIFGDLIF
jgi:hypothetical protein